MLPKTLDQPKFTIYLVSFTFNYISMRLYCIELQTIQSNGFIHNALIMTHECDPHINCASTNCALSIDDRLLVCFFKQHKSYMPSGFFFVFNRLLKCNRYLSVATVAMRLCRLCFGFHNSCTVIVSMLKNQRQKLL